MCQHFDKTTKQPTGFVWNLIGKLMGKPSIFFMTDLGLWLGLGIILVTVISSNHHLPLGIYQSWSNLPEDESSKPIFCADPRTHQNGDSRREIIGQPWIGGCSKSKWCQPIRRHWLFAFVDSNAFFSALYLQLNTLLVLARTLLGIGPGSKKSCFNLVVAGSLLRPKYALLLYRRWTKEKLWRNSLKPYYDCRLLFDVCWKSLYWVWWFVQIIQQFVINYLIRPKLRKQ